jgi:hypothetical protein
LRISVTGQLIKREGYQPRAKTSDEDWEKNISILQRIVIELQKFDFAPVPPSLQVKFSGDVAEFEKAHVEATLRGERIGRANYEIRGLSAAAEWADQTLTVTHCEWSDGRGNLAAHLSWSRPGNSAEFQLRSSLDLKKFVEAFELGDWLADTTFYTPPLLEVSGSANLSGERPQLKLIGRAQAEGHLPIGGDFRRLDRAATAAAALRCCRRGRGIRWSGLLRAEGRDGERGDNDKKRDGLQSVHIGLLG